MLVRCHFRTYAERGACVRWTRASRRAPSTLRFPADNRPLSGFLWSYVRSGLDPISLHSGIGQGRAFTETPANGTVLQPEAARRRL